MAAQRVPNAWGDDDPSQTLGRDESGSSTPTRRTLPPDRSRSKSATARQLIPDILHPGAGTTWAQRGLLPPLRALCLGFLGRHVDALVAQLGTRLAPLPSDIKACLLCVARRRGLLTNRVLSSLVDDGWQLLDLAGAAALSERAVRQALMRCPRIRALDVTGVTHISPALLRDLPSLCPCLEVLVVGGGGKAMEAVLLEVLPELLPHIKVREQSTEAELDSWEEAAGRDAAGGRVQLPDPGVPRGLQRLKLLVWPGAPPLAHHTVRTVSPRVDLAEQLPPPQLPYWLTHPLPQGAPHPHAHPPSTSARGVRVSLATRIGGGGDAGPGSGEGSSLWGRAVGRVGVSASSHSCGGSRAGGGGGGGHGAAAATLRGTINVLRVRTAPGGGGGGAAGQSGGVQEAAAGVRAGGGGRYTAPALRQQQQQQQQSQLPQLQRQQSHHPGPQRPGEQQQQQHQEEERDEASRTTAAAVAVLSRALAERNPQAAAATAAAAERNPGPHMNTLRGGVTSGSTNAANVAAAAANLGRPAGAGGVPRGLGEGGPSQHPPPLPPPPSLLCGTAAESALTHGSCPLLSSSRVPQLDDCLASLVSDDAWEGLGPGEGEGKAREEELHIAEKFRLAYVEQQARMEAKEQREAAAAERYQLKVSGAARALASWLDAE